MEENKYLCPQCGSEMNATFEKPALNLFCPNCGCQVATTKWDEIDLDDNTYGLIIEEIESPSFDVIKLISRLTGKNFVESKERLINGQVSFTGNAIEIRDKRDLLDSNNIKYHYTKEFPY